MAKIPYKASYLRGKFGIIPHNWLGRDTTSSMFTCRHTARDVGLGSIVSRCTRPTSGTEAMSAIRWNDACPAQFLLLFKKKEETFSSFYRSPNCCLYFACPTTIRRVYFKG